MVTVSVFNKGDGTWPDLEEKKAAGLLIDAMDTDMHLSFALLERGTVSGKPTVTIRIDLEDGRLLLVQTTLELFGSAADQLRAAHMGNQQFGV